MMLSSVRKIKRKRMGKLKYVVYVLLALVLITCVTAPAYKVDQNDTEVGIDKDCF